MKKLRIYNFDLRVGNTDYAGYGSFNLIGLIDPTPTTVNNFIDIYVPKVERETLNPVHLLELDRQGEDLDAYFPQENLLSLFNDFDYQQLNNGNSEHPADGSPLGPANPSRVFHKMVTFRNWHRWF